MTNGIAGGGGEMGRFLEMLLSPLGEIIKVSRKSSKEDWQKMWQSDVIWLSVPRDSIGELLKDRKLRKDQLIIDICSLKRGLSKVIQKTGATHLSLHPLHGPYIPLSGQKWAIIPTHKEVEDNKHAKKILDFLKSKEIKFIKAESEDHHDFMLAITLSMPEIITIVIDEIIKQYVNDAKLKAPTKEELMKWSIPAFNSIIKTYNHIVNSTAPWLRSDLICKSHNNLIKSAQKAFNKLGKDMSREVIEGYLKDQEANIGYLTHQEKENCRSWLERWFVDTNKRIFMSGNKSISKPELSIQFSESIDKIFPKSNKKINIGIHGIAGSFTHESVLRFCEENNINYEMINFSFLVTSENVLKALEKKEIDIGVFAMANSGSGAYVSSMHAMGDFNYDVLAIYGMEIIQCMMGNKEINIEDIKEVFGHPQAVSQCRRTFEEKYPQIKLVYGEDKDDTALCAKMIAEKKLPKETVTLASQVAAKLYDLKIFTHGMHHDPYNTTTFLIVKRKNI